MHLADLKKACLNNELTDELLVFNCEGDLNLHFLVDLALKEICSTKYSAINHVNSLFESSSSSKTLVFNYEDYLNVLEVDTFNESAEDYSIFTNTVVVCDKIDKSISQEIEPFKVKLIKPNEWHTKSYISVMCPELSFEDIDWLYSYLGNDLYHLENELAKITSFSPENRRSIFTEIKYDRNSNIISYPVFKLTNAIVSKNINEIKECLFAQNNSDFEPLGVVTILLKQFKNIALVCGGSSLTKQQLIDCGISEKQIAGIKYRYSSLSDETLLKIIDFLSGIDHRLKEGDLGELTGDKSYFLDYIINTVLCYLLH